MPAPCLTRSCSGKHSAKLSWYVVPSKSSRKDTCSTLSTSVMQRRNSCKKVWIFAGPSSWCTNTMYILGCGKRSSSLPSMNGWKQSYIESANFKKIGCDFIVLVAKINCRKDGAASSPPVPSFHLKTLTGGVMGMRLDLALGQACVSPRPERMTRTPPWAGT